VSDSERYDEKAVSQILRRAAELEQGGVRGSGGGLTRADIERVATEAGLDPAAVRTAIAEQSPAQAPELRSESGFLGGPLRVRVERMVEAKLDEDGVEDLLDSAQHRLGMSGEWRSSGRRHTWSPKGVARNLQVRVQRREERAEILLDERLGPLVGGLWGGLFGGLSVASMGLAGALGLGAFRSLPAMVGIMGVGLVGAWFVTRKVFGAVAAKKTEELVELADRLAAEARAAAAATGLEAAGDEEEDRDELRRGREPQRRDRDEDPSRRRGARRRSRD
jgi:hypothetical protein